jgi:AGCS family alanine or glycine:cation symporter
VGLAVITWLVIVGGIKVLGKVTEILSPFMVLLYVLGGLITVVIFASNVPKALEMILVGAFKPSALGGGVVGVSIARAMRYGMARGNYSNEAGIGTAGVFHAAAKTSEPARQGFLGSLDVFIDTIVICTLTALAILASGAWTQGTSTAMTANAYNQAIPQWGGLIVAASSFLFGYSSLIGVTYYGKIALSYLLGPWIYKPYNWIYCVFVFIGATLKVELAWSIGDLVNGLMIVTNVIGIIGLSGLAVGLIKSYGQRMDSADRDIVPSQR